MNKFLRNVGFYLLIILVAITVIDHFSVDTSNKQEINYTEFVKQVDDKNVAKVVMQNSNIKGTLKDGTEFTTITPGYPNSDEELVKTLRDNGVDIKAENPPETPWWTTLFSSLLPMLLLIGVWFFIMQQSQGGGSRVMSFGKSRAKMMGDGKVKVTFSDVAGADEAKQELAEVVEFLKHPKKFNDLGARIPKGVLLFGPPGTGKTLLAKAVAGEAGVPFFTISGSDFVEMFVGVGASRVRDLFEQAKKNAPCIVFIDEIDAIGKSRDSRYGGGNDEREQTLNQLLSEMDGFDGSKGVVILAATNRPESLDKALLRPGRFDRRIPVELPDLQGREAILKVHAKAIKTCDDIDYLTVARATAGASGAELANIVNEAALRAVKMNRTCVSQSDLEESVEVVIAGYQRKGAVIPPEEKKIVAYHEIGHALVAALQKKSAPVHKITIIPRTSGALGYTMQVSETDNVLMSKEELFNKIVTITGGRSAEEVIFSSITSGASNDIEQATKLARAMVTRLGMTEEFDMMATETMTNIYLGGDPSLNCSDETASKIDAKVLEIIKEAHQKAREILEENKEKLHELAAFLLERETITGEEFMRLLNSEADVIETSATVVKEGEADAEEASSI